MFSKIHHTAYSVRDLKAAVAWYENTFAAKLVGEGSGPFGKIAFLHMGEAEVELIEPADQSALSGGLDHVFNHVGYVVDDFDKAVEDFKTRGYKFATAEPVINPVGHRIFLLDPSGTNGTRIHLTDANSL